VDIIDFISSHAGPAWHISTFPGSCCFTYSCIISSTIWFAIQSRGSPRSDLRSIRAERQSNREVTTCTTKSHQCNITNKLVWLIILSPSNMWVKVSYQSYKKHPKSWAGHSHIQSYIARLLFRDGSARRPPAILVVFLTLCNYWYSRHAQLFFTTRVTHKLVYFICF
jgi:hypothetical protein